MQFPKVGVAQPAVGIEPADQQRLGLVEAVGDAADDHLDGVPGLDLAPSTSPRLVCAVEAFGDYAFDA
jgi:hypothetical protein